jgi:hypothetical protein
MWERVYIVSPIINLGIRWMSVVNFTIRLLYPREKNSRYPMNRRPYGSQSGHKRFEEDTNLFPLMRIDNRFLVRPGHSLITIQTELPAPKINSRQTLSQQEKQIIHNTTTNNNNVTATVTAITTKTASATANSTITTSHSWRFLPAVWLLSSLTR